MSETSAEKQAQRCGLLGADVDRTGTPRLVWTHKVQKATQKSRLQLLCRNHNKRTAHTHTQRRVCVCVVVTILALTDRSLEVVCYKSVDL